MNKEIPVKKNEEYIIDISGMGYDGEGIGKVENFTVFIPGAIEGENAKVKILSVKKNYGYGKLMEIIKPSEKRVAPVCPSFGKCGGCGIQHLDYSYQLQIKRKRVEDALERIGKLERITVHNTIGMDNPYDYRNKVQLPVGEDKNGNIVVGFYAPRSHNIIDIDTCFIQEEVSYKVVQLIKVWMNKYHIKPYNEEKHNGLVRHIMVRKGFKTREVMVVIVTNGDKLPNKDELIKSIVDNIEGIHSIIQNVNSKRTNVILGSKCKTLWGQEHITDYIEKFKFNISPLSFFQVNPGQTEVLYRKALEYADLKGDEVVFDAYCGTGTISLFLSQKSKRVYGVEIIKEAIENARENSKVNNINNAEFIVGKSEEEIPKLISKGIIPDVVVVDPPRKGCEKTLVESICKSNPKKVVYVSCDPGTLARDLAIFHELGYKTEEVQPVDMFPQTMHVETVCLLTRK
ncbi:23S rRNA (uracil(1939)-C(5))-methyltransferase RlmD [Haloimpatiens massiliensis]|uniref:23S rRNA (uracil(1939)-C(5))-methyltransferase RlmD n=1 Tax=Haloimpatiens massiliensis TaxID=1658110 RepID=UPI000C829305|nr:23S rRNA (uracil(1939)-C(5))-methyltransferase RlmD [Haloimpatiens massiliensis]